MVPDTGRASRVSHPGRNAWIDHMLSVGGAGEGSLKMTEVDQIHVGVAIEVGPDASWTGVGVGIGDAVLEEVVVNDIHVVVAVEIPAGGLGDGAVADVVPLGGALQEPRFGPEVYRRIDRRIRTFWYPRIDHFAIDVADVKVFAEELQAVGMRDVWLKVRPYDREVRVTEEPNQVVGYREMIQDSKEIPGSKGGWSDPVDLGAVSIGEHSPLDEELIDVGKTGQRSQVVKLSTARRTAAPRLNMLEEPSVVDPLQGVTGLVDGLPASVRRKGGAFV